MSIQAESRFEYGTMTTRPTARRNLITYNQSVQERIVEFGTTGVITDIYDSAPITISEDGVYRFYICSYLSVNGAIANIEVVFEDGVTPNISIGTVDFYSLLTVCTISASSLFTLAEPKDIRLRLDITGRTVGSVDYRLSAGSIVLYKYK